MKIIYFLIICFITTDVKASWNNIERKVDPITDSITVSISIEGKNLDKERPEDTGLLTIQCKQGPIGKNVEISLMLSRVVGINFNSDKPELSDVILRFDKDSALRIPGWAGYVYDHRIRRNIC